MLLAVQEYQDQGRLLGVHRIINSYRSRPPGFEYSPHVLFSPPFQRKGPILLDLEAKQEKAQEFREQNLNEKTKKRAEKDETVAQRLMKLEEEKQLKKEILDEKMQRAEQNRAHHIRSIQLKAKSEFEKFDDVQSSSITMYLLLTQTTIKNK
jgi:hypothetical protein